MLPDDLFGERTGVLADIAGDAENLDPAHGRHQGAVRVQGRRRHGQHHSVAVLARAQVQGGARHQQLRGFRVPGLGAGAQAQKCEAEQAGGWENCKRQASQDVPAGVLVGDDVAELATHIVGIDPHGFLAPDRLP